MLWEILYYILWLLNRFCSSNNNNVINSAPISKNTLYISRVVESGSFLERERERERERTPFLQMIHAVLGCKGTNNKSHRNAPAFREWFPPCTNQSQKRDSDAKNYYKTFDEKLSFAWRFKFGFHCWNLDEQNKWLKIPFVSNSIHYITIFNKKLK